MVIPHGVVEKVAAWADGKVAAPQRVLVYPTNVCNLRCVFCYQSLEPYPYDTMDGMSDEKWLAIVEELGSMGMNTLQISGGGEPMLRGELVLKMMARAKCYGLTGRLVNNGTRWNEEWIRKVIDLKWDNVIFSVDGATAEVHDRMRGKKGLFALTTSNIRRFTELKRELGREKPLLEFSHVLTRWNYEQTPALVELARDLGVGVITYEPVFVSNPFVHKIKLTRQERVRYMAEIVPRALDVANSYQIRTNLDHVMDLRVIEKTGELKEHILGKESFMVAERAREEHELRAVAGGILDIPCYESWLWPKVEANGDVGPCSTNMLRENIKEKTFSDIWFGPVFTEFRRRILDRDLPDGCENCVGTHLAWNREIRQELGRYYLNGRKGMAAAPHG